MINYAGIAKNGYVIADYSLTEADFRVEFQQISTSAQKDAPRSIEKRGEHAYHVRNAADGYMFCCVPSPLADQSKLPLEFLDNFEKRIKEYFSAHATEEGGAKSSATDLTRIFQELMVMCGLSE